MVLQELILVEVSRYLGYLLITSTLELLLLQYVTSEQESGKYKIKEGSN